MKTNLTRLVLAFSTLVLMTAAVAPAASATTLLPACNSSDVVCENHPCRPFAGTCRWLEDVHRSCVDGPIAYTDDLIPTLLAFADRLAGCDLS